MFFAQEHRPGALCQSDFTHCRELGVTVNGQAFPHLIYHFVLSYSNWETGSICYSETFESLSEGLQNALWQLGGVPSEHRTDRMSAAVNNLSDAKEFTRAYEGLLRHYRIDGQKIQAGNANENGDVEQRHYLQAHRPARIDGQRAHIVGFWLNFGAAKTDAAIGAL